MQLQLYADSAYLNAGVVCFWDLVEETMVHQIQAHTSAVCSVAMHPEAKCMVSASNDGTAKVWQPSKLM